ncbi:MAG TPA: hypothetical protein VII00_07675 [bacterium]
MFDSVLKELEDRTRRLLVVLNKLREENESLKQEVKKKEKELSAVNSKVEDSNNKRHSAAEKLDKVINHIEHTLLVNRRREISAGSEE